MAKDKVQTQPPKGTRDFLPVDIRRREHVVGVIRRTYEAHGFEPLETPSFERLETLLGKYGDEGDQLVFKIQSRGQEFVHALRRASAALGAPADDGGGVAVIAEGRSGEVAPALEVMMADYGLRYDLTVPLARVVAEHQGKLPHVFKRFQIQPVWRADRPGKGRFREFYQCDVDVVGTHSPVVEAELLGAVAQAIRNLGFERFDIRVNHRVVLRALIDSVGIPAALETAAIVAIDKLDKVSPEAVQEELERKGVSAVAAAELLRRVGSRPAIDEVARYLARHASGDKAIDELTRILDLAHMTPAHQHLCFDATLARGLGYYTGAIFEIAVPDLAGSLGGGGRYDNLIGMFSGRAIPACGFSIGLERILVVMEQRGMFPAALAGIDALLGAADERRVEDALRLAYKLRAAGWSVDLEPRIEKPSKLRKLADERGIAHALWLEGDDPNVKFWTKATGETGIVGVDDASHLLKRP